MPPPPPGGAGGALVLVLVLAGPPAPWPHRLKGVQGLRHGALRKPRGLPGHCTWGPPLWWFAPGFGTPRESVQRSLECSLPVLPLDQPQPSRGGGGAGQLRPTPSPSHIRKTFLWQQLKFIKGAGNLRPIVGTQTFCWPLTHFTPKLSNGSGPGRGSGSSTRH